MMVAPKVSLLLTPHELLRSHNIMSALHVQKQGKMISHSERPLTAQELKLYFQPLNPAIREALKPFNPDVLETIGQLALKKLNGSKAGVDVSQFLLNAMLRHLHQAFETLRPFLGTVKWYHKIPGNNQRVTIAPCAFSQHKPVLCFEVERAAKKRLQLHTYFSINGARFKAGDFKRDGFLLFSSGEYFVLSFRDYQTLEWLEQIDLNALGADDMVFLQEVLVKLEANYKVNRNHLFVKKEIRCVPQNRVLLSELNNAFLMLTPQWTYDGILVDGPWAPTYELMLQGEETVIYRDEQAEKEFVEKLRAMHANFTTQRNGYFYLPFADAQKKQWFLKVYHSLLEQEIELTGMDMLQHFRYSPHKADTQWKVLSEHNHQVELELEVRFGAEKILLPELQKMLLAGQKAILLKDNSLGILGDDWMKRFATMIKHGKVSKNKVEVARFLAFNEQDASADEAVLKTLVKEEWWKKWQRWQQGNEQVYAVPGNVSVTLRPYQQRGYEWLALLAEAGAGGCLADDMGLGKTLQAICFIARHIEQQPAAKCIIVAPASLLFNWLSELEKFAPSIQAQVYYGAGRQQVTGDSWQVLITSYGTLRADAGTLADKVYDIAVIDESHNIKNPTAQITAAVSSLRAGCRIALSGTPVINNTFDLYSQFNFALPGLFGNREFFRKEYADAIDRYRDEEKIKALHKLTAPFILRRTKEQVAPDLPEKTEMVLWCQMGAQQQQLYDEIKSRIYNEITTDVQRDGLGKSKLAVIQGLLKLRQVCNSPLLLPADERDHCSESAKTEALIARLKNIGGGHKALVFSQFASMLHLLAGELEKQGLTFYHFDGSTPAAKRTEMVKAFQDPTDTTQLFLISLKAGNAGLTLTAADYVFLFDPWWNTAVEQQAIDRTHRIGQTRQVFAYKIICRNTIEEKIVLLQQRKKLLADELVSEDESFIKSLTEDDIAYLFG